MNRDDRIRTCVLVIPKHFKIYFSNSSGRQKKEWDEAGEYFSYGSACCKIYKLALRFKANSIRTALSLMRQTKINLSTRRIFRKFFKNLGIIPYDHNTPPLSGANNSAWGCLSFLLCILVVILILMFV